MNIQIISDEKKPLLNRREISAKIGFDNKTPSRANIKKEIAKKLNVKEDLVVVKLVNPDYGTTSAVLEIDVYDNEKTMKDVASDYLAKRGVPKGKKGESESAPAAPAPAETPKKEEKPEEKKEDAPKEEKKEEAKEEKK
ncbi:MAG: hypothetical protein KKF46_04405 [Nanoarchaeota archaeon]|nr:hypothetical protein [Nanoarchaeota archaeon]MBU1321578.1 hypothetical protein [Nanoarchaeota archaeon]MBU1598377.1 hypothetical protein [Nanoarchaeota archaeon]MBU2442134.1 hypothetical protein [Nanoarchaeota archaeon]